MKVDDLAGLLGRVEVPLDDLTRARVASRIDAAIREEDAAAPAPRRGGAVLAIAGLAAAAAVVAWVATRDRGVVTGVAAPPPAPEASAEAAVQIDGMTVTAFGPGTIVERDDVVTIDGPAFVIDRAAGDAPAVIAYGGLRIRVLRATFAVDAGARPRVTVMRGQVVLVCPDGEQTVEAGGTGVCAEPAPTPVVLVEEAPPTAAPPRIRRERAAPAPVELVEAAPVARPLTAEERYARAEAAMARGDSAAAADELAALAAVFPDAPETAAALLDLARLSARRGDRAAARDALDRLAAHPRGGALAEPAAHLRCKLADDRLACLRDLRRAFPDSARDAETLAQLATGLAAADDCAGALPLLDEYLERYPSRRDAGAVRGWRERCEP